MPSDTTASWPGSGLSYIKKPKAEPKSKGPKEFYYNQPFIDYWGKKFTEVEGEVGLEIECEGKNLFNTPIKFWKASSDNSLRNKDGHPPVEYVLKTPLPRTEIPRALEYLSKQLLRAESELDWSTRTSVHVHINCQKKTLKEILTFICLYLIFEEALVEFSGPTRVGNLFCLRAKDAEYWVWSIVQALKQQYFANIFSDNFRYTSCNTASLAKFGSLEFRSMRGTVSKELIQTWVDLLLYISDESLRFSDPLKLYESFFNFGPEDFFKSIFFKNQKLYNVLKDSTPTLYLGMKEGSVFVRDIAGAVDEWVLKGKLIQEPEVTSGPSINYYDIVNPPAIQHPAAPISTGNSARYARYQGARDGINGGDFFIADEDVGEEFGHPYNVEQYGSVWCPAHKKIWFDGNGWICITDYDGEVTTWLI